LPPSTLSKRVSIVLFLAIVAFYFYGLGHLPLVGPDEPRYAQVAREMFLRHDLVTPTLGGHTWFEKPALLYWLMIASFKILGVSEFSARLGSAVCGLLTILAVWLVAGEVERGFQRREQSGYGFLSALVVATCLGLIVFARGASFDIVIVMTTTWALCLFHLQELTEVTRKRSLLLAGFYVFVGLSLIAKGLVGIVIPLGVVLCYFVLRRSWPRSTWLSLFWGLPLAILISAIWYGPVISRNGWPFIDEFFIQHHFARYLSNKYHHPQPIYFYLPIAALLTLPWTAFLVDALVGVRLWHWKESDPLSKTRVFAFAWFVVPILFFSFSGSKLPGYILPVVPAAAFLIADRMAHGQSRWPMRATGLICVVLGVIGFVFLWRSGFVNVWCALLVAIPLLVGGLCAVLWKRTNTTSVSLIASSILVMLVVVLICAAPSFAQRDSVRDLLEIADARGYGQAPVYARQGSDRTAEFYAQGRVVYGADGEPVVLEEGPQLLSEAHKHGGKILVFVPPDYVEAFRRLPGVEVIGDNGEVALVGVSLR